MSITISDPGLLAQLGAVNGAVELKDPLGRILGTVFTTVYGDLPRGTFSPISDAEFEERRKQQNGRPLAEILRDLTEKHEG